MIILEANIDEQNRAVYLKKPSEHLIKIGSKVFLLDEEVVIQDPPKVKEYNGHKYKVWIIEREGGFTPITELLTKEQQSMLTQH